MSISVDVFIKYKGTKKSLVNILAKDFLILIDQKHYWFLNYIEFGLVHRSDDPGYFMGRSFRPYDFLIGSTTYAWA